MPAKSAKQAKFMAAVANNPKFAKKVDVPQSVGQDFSNADKRNKDMRSKTRRTAADTAGRRSARTTSNSKTTGTGQGYARGGRTAADTAGRRSARTTSNSKTTGTGQGRSHVQGYNMGGVMAHDKKELRNLSDEDYRIRNRSGSNTAAERKRIDGERSYLRNQESSYAPGGKVRGCGVAQRGLTKGTVR